MARKNQEVKNPIVEDSTIFGLDADDRTGREENAEIRNERGKGQSQEDTKKDKASEEAARKTAEESLEAQKITNAESRRAE